MRLSLKTAALAILILACSGETLSGPGPPPPPPTSPAVTSVKLSRDTATLVPDATVQITASALDANGQTLDGSASWSSSDETKARVANGVVTGVAPGAATITATVEGRTAQAVVTVIDGGVVSAAGRVVLPTRRRPVSSTVRFTSMRLCTSRCGTESNNWRTVTG